MIVEWAKTSDFSEARRPISDYFDRMYFSYKLKCMKPHPEIFRKMIADSNIIPSNSLYIDDNIQHLETARSLGFVTLLAENGKDWRADVDRCLKPSGQRHQDETTQERPQTVRGVRLLRSHVLQPHSQQIGRAHV